MIKKKNNLETNEGKCANLSGEPMVFIKSYWIASWGISITDVCLRFHVIHFGIAFWRHGP